MTRDHLDFMPEQLKHVLDALSIATMLGSLAQVLPSIAAVLTIVWTALRIWESKTVQGWRRRPATPDSDTTGE